MLEAIGNADLWADKGGILGLVLLALFILLFIETVMLRRSHDKMVNAMVKHLYTDGHLKDRRKKKLDVDMDRRTP